jgi:hypothetical protein
LSTHTHLNDDACIRLQAAALRQIASLRVSALLVLFFSSP